MMALLNWQIQANTNITMKTEVVKLLDFYRKPNKDTITALKFMAHIEECQITNQWNDIMTSSYFWLALHGQAEKWLSSIVCHLQLTAATLFSFIIYKTRNNGFTSKREHKGCFTVIEQKRGN